MRALAVAVALFAATTAHARKPALERAGDVTVMAFGSAACAPCRAERPMLAALARKYAGDDGVRVVVVSVDDDAGARAYARLFGDDITVPRLAVLDRAARGLERTGARAGERSDDFVREVSAAIDAVRAHAEARPSSLWRPLRAQ